MTLPCQLVGELGDLTARLGFRRRFGWLGRLEAHERLWLTLATTLAGTEAWLNGRLLGQHQGTGSSEYDVTALVKPRNELKLVVEPAGPSGGSLDEVAIEVRAVLSNRPPAIRDHESGTGADYP